MHFRIANADSATMGLLFAMLLAVTVKQADAPLRAGGCGSDAPLVMKLAAGTTVEVRSSIAGAGGACYRVSAQVDGKTVSGNISGSALEGLESFEQARQMASGSGETVQMTTARQVESLRKSLTGAAGSGGMREASMLLDQNQPGRALEILKPIAASGNPDAMVMAGVAAWKSDQIGQALEHWRAAQSIRPSPQLAAMIRKIETEAAHDKSGEKLLGLRVALRYEGQALPYATAKKMLSTLDSEVARIGAIVGCPSHERLVAIIQSPEAYFKGAMAAEWSGGQFDGRIRIPFAPGAEVDDALQRVLAHEATHACLANLGPWPAWLHEGLAQKLSGERLSPGMRESLKELAAKKELPKLQELRQNWAGLTSQKARIAYALALAAAEEMLDGPSGSIGLRNILSNPAVLDQVTNSINQRLGL
jgi:hypothetical protein